MTQDGTKWAAVGDDENASIRMLLGNRAKGAKYTRGELVDGLCVAPRAAVGLRKTLVDLRGEHALPAAEMLLSEFGQLLDREAEAVGDRPGCLSRTCQVARVDGIQALAPELFGERARLGLAGRVQRPVGMALHAPFRVPVRLTVPHEEDLGHRR